MRRTTFILTTMLIASCTMAQSERTTNAFGFQDDQNASVIDSASVWSHFGGNASHQGQAFGSMDDPSLQSPNWIGSDHSLYIPVAQSGLVADQQRIYAIATLTGSPGSNFAIAMDRITGEPIWETPISPIILDSWSTPTIDVQHNQLIVVSADTIAALDCESGSINWSTPIGSVIVNASPTVTSDLGFADRAFITNYSFGGASAKLTCINIDPFHATHNPYQLGQIVWQASLNGDSSGNTAAYSNGQVFVATASNGSSPRGKILAFDATSTTSPSPIWTFTNTINTGFFGGVSITRGHIYASSYNFSGLQTSANTVKLNKNTGSLVWSVPTNRTDATPVVLANSDVIVSSGIATGAFDFLPFFGSLPSIQYIHDDGNNASLAWDSALETHIDTNNNGVWDFNEPYLSIGGWTHQPITLTINNTPMLLVGTLPQTTPGVQVGHNTDLHLIDLTKLPNDPDFIVHSFLGAGSTPAIIDGWIYTSGANGIHGFSPSVNTPLELIERFTNGKLTIDQLNNQLKDLQTK